MQQMVIDVAGIPFPRFMEETVLGPIGMTSSSFEQPQPPVRAALTAAGYYADRRPVLGRWHVYPELAAAGLWTTATDLARFAIEIQETLAGRGHGIISPSMARQYVTEQKGGSGLGIGVSGSGRTLSFSHGGRDEGFDAQLVAFAETGQGAAIMINANDNSRFMRRILDFVGRAWGWPRQGSPADPAAAAGGARLPAAQLARFAGYYETAENQMTTLVPSGDGAGLHSLVDGLPDEIFVSLDSVRFGSVERGLRFAFTLNPAGAVTAAVLRPGEGPREHRAPRVAPLPSSRSPAPDPDPALSTRITAALDAIRQGGKALADAERVTPGAKKDFGAGHDPALEGLGALTYLGEEDVSGRGIHRHGGDVARVRYFAVTTAAGKRYLLVHLTAEGSLTDYDVVER